MEPAHRIVIWTVAIWLVVLYGLGGVASIGCGYIGQVLGGCFTLQRAFSNFRLTYLGQSFRPRTMGTEVAT